MTALKWIVAIAASGYCAFVAFLYVTQRQFLYHPQSIHPSPVAAGLPNAAEAVIETSDGERVIVWHVPPLGENPVVIYFHGNAEIVARRASRHRELTAKGNGLVALSYRGYMGSSGAPTEEGLLRDAEAAYRFATSNYPSSPIVLWGHSLGTGVAVALAGGQPVAGVALESPYSSTADVAARLFPFVPVRWLMHDQFRSDLRIDTVRAPLLIMHGARDWVVPIELGERLFARAREPKRFVRFPEGGHDDLDRYGAGTEVQRFIEERRP
jgi:fermentation-respiration switch protein FrsA (DUF1100 family)